MIINYMSSSGLAASKQHLFLGTKGVVGVFIYPGHHCIGGLLVRDNYNFFCHVPYFFPHGVPMHGAHANEANCSMLYMCVLSFGLFCQISGSLRTIINGE